MADVLSSGPTLIDTSAFGGFWNGAGTACHAKDYIYYWNARVPLDDRQHACLCAPTTVYSSFLSSSLSSSLSPSSSSLSSPPSSFSSSSASSSSGTSTSLRGASGSTPSSLDISR